MRLPCLFAAALALAAPIMPAHAGLDCPAAPRMSVLRLPHLRTALARGTEGVIVALGSSSTEGVMASDLAHSYPAVLQAALSRALPNAHLAVLNRGIGGQDAPEELARLTSDVIAVQPQLVIWQVGANGALRNADPAEFRELVTAGVTRLQEAGIDVVLMDNQHTPRVDAAPEHGVLNQVLAEVAKATGASLFARSVLMDGWAEEGAPSLQFVAIDGLHHNNRGYHCVAEALAGEIVTAVHTAPTLAAAR